MKPNKTDTIKKEFLVNLANSLGIVTSACKKTGINRSTYYDWLKNDLEFASDCDHVVEEAIDFVESQLLQKISDGDITAIIFFLRTKGRKRGYDGKDKRVAVKLPRLDNIHGVSDALDVVVSKLASTEITEAQAIALMEALEQKQKMIGVVDLEVRLSELEKRVAG